MKAVKKITFESTEIRSGLYSKKDAAIQIAQGQRHVHSSLLGSKDPLVKLSEKAVLNNTEIRYPWEQFPGGACSRLNSSKERRAVIETIWERLDISGKKSVREKIDLILEELITNGIYHAYLHHSGDEKYCRKNSVELTSKETLLIEYGSNANGIYISVTDQGGGLPFDKIAKVFERCYTATGENQLESKTGGAGLGMYLVFETVTHLKVTSRSGLGTTVSCWIANKASYDPDHFSFNYFEEGTKK